MADTSTPTLSVAFPLGKTGGLIEAGYRARVPVLYTMFPLGKTGGLIEAQNCIQILGFS